MRKLSLFAAAVALALTLVPGFASAQVFFDIPADRDNTLFEPGGGAPPTEGPPQTSNGAGPHIFAGSTIGGDVRRAAIHFDTSSIPMGSTVVSAQVTLVSDMAIDPNPSDMSLHRLTADWGEGTSNSSGMGGGGGGGGGTTPTAGDATWIHTFFDTDFWTAAGGDFDPMASATTAVTGSGALGAQTWGSTAAMVADVEGWIANPASNFGWVLVGDESATATARRFHSRESLAEGGVVPILTVEIAGGPNNPLAIPTLSQWGLAIMAVLMLILGIVWVSRRRTTA